MASPIKRICPLCNNVINRGLWQHFWDEHKGHPWSESEFLQHLLGLDEIPKCEGCGCEAVIDYAGYKFRRFCSRSCTGSVVGANTIRKWKLEHPEEARAHSVKVLEGWKRENPDKVGSWMREHPELYAEIRRENIKIAQQVYFNKLRTDPEFYERMRKQKSESTSRYLAEHPEMKGKGFRDWRANCPEESSEVSRRNLATMREKYPQLIHEMAVRAGQRLMDWRRSHPEESKAYSIHALELAREYNPEWAKYHLRDWMRSHPEEARAIRSQTVKALIDWRSANPELAREITIKNFFSTTYISKIELKMFDRFKRLFPDEEVVSNFPIVGYRPDIIFTKRKLIIEIDGANWHDTQRDIIRDTRLYELGYKIRRLDAEYVRLYPTDKELIRLVEVESELEVPYYERIREDDILNWKWNCTQIESAPLTVESDDAERRSYS